MNRNHALLVCSALVLMSVGTVAFYYGRLPPIIPTHWDIHGNVNGYMPKFWGVVLWPAMLAVFCGLLVALPTMSPKKFSLEQSIGTFNLLMVAVSAFLFVVSFLALQAATGAQTNMQAVVPGLIGVLFVVIGNYMGKIRKNFFMGIRTPWTLASDEVWARTHRLGGWVFMLGGLAVIVEAIVGVNPSILLSIVAVMVIVPIAYSFYLYKRIEGFGPDDSTPTENNS